MPYSIAFLRGFFLLYHSLPLVHLLVYTWLSYCAKIYSFAFLLVSKKRICDSIMQKCANTMKFESKSLLYFIHTHKHTTYWVYGMHVCKSFWNIHLDIFCLPVRTKHCWILQPLNFIQLHISAHTFESHSGIPFHFIIISSESHKTVEKWSDCKKFLLLKWTLNRLIGSNGEKQSVV